MRGGEGVYVPCIMYTEYSVLYPAYLGLGGWIEGGLESSVRVCMDVST